MDNPTDAQYDFRMSFGEHLEELRSRLLLALVGVVVGAIACLIWGKQIFSFICRPALKALHTEGEAVQLYTTHFSEAFTVYLKLALACGIIVASPWVLYQIWAFIASGLRPGERKFMRRYGPMSMVLFISGVLFLYYVVAPIILSFFIRFNHTMGNVDYAPTVQVSAGDDSSSLRVPIVDEDPAEVGPGQIWVNRGQRALCVAVDKEIFRMQIPASAFLRPLFSLSRYVTMIAGMALMFGIGFQTPVVVLFLDRSGILTASDLAKARKYVLLALIFLAAVFTPPDPFSQLALALPMYLLFELGLALCRRK